MRYAGIGPFLAYQLITDVNYTHVTDFSEMEFVEAGPGAKSGLEKCFGDFGTYGYDDLIRWTAERQEEEFCRRGICFKDLWGRPLQLVDCQNLYCEIDKYARVAFPGYTSSSGRVRIKQKYVPYYRPVELWFPPKWGLNEALPASAHPVDSMALEATGRTASTAPEAPGHHVVGQDRLFL
jgi:hypothetical protein